MLCWLLKPLFSIIICYKLLILFSNWHVKSEWEITFVWSLNQSLSLSSYWFLRTGERLPGAEAQINIYYFIFFPKFPQIPTKILVWLR